jgi:hypothetical protein
VSEVRPPTGESSSTSWLFVWPRLLAVGLARRAGDNNTGASTYDLAAAQPRMAELPTLDPDAASTATAISADGTVVVETEGRPSDILDVEAHHHASARFRTSVGPSVHENVRRATVTVVRNGATTPAVTVTYTGGGNLGSRSGPVMAQMCLAMSADQTAAGFQSGVSTSATRLSRSAARVTPSTELTSTSSCSMFKVPS